MDLIDNRFTRAKNARYWALGLFALGVVLQDLGALLQADWSVYISIAALVIWIYPICWAGYRFAYGSSK